MIWRALWWLLLLAAAWVATVWAWAALEYLQTAGRWDGSYE